MEKKTSLDVGTKRKNLMEKHRDGGMEPKPGPTEGQRKCFTGVLSVGMLIKLPCSPQQSQERVGEVPSLPAIFFHPYLGRLMGGQERRGGQTEGRDEGRQHPGAAGGGDDTHILVRAFQNKSLDKSEMNLRRCPDSMTWVFCLIKCHEGGK